MTVVGSRSVRTSLRLEAGLDASPSFLRDWIRPPTDSALVSESI